MNYDLSKKFYNIASIPKHWKCIRLKYILSISDVKSDDPDNEEILALTQNGIIKRDISSNEGQVAKSYKKYNLVNEGQICMNPMDLLSGWVDISTHKGLISPAYYTFTLKKEITNDFLKYFLQSNYIRGTFFTLGKGVASHDNFGRWVLTPEELRNIYIFYPTLVEQNKISSYLDEKRNNYDTRLEKYQEKIKHLKEKRIATINYITKNGIIRNVEKKESNILWLGKIPKHWKVIKLKYLADHITEKCIPKNTDVKISPENVESQTGRITNYYSDYETSGYKFINGDILFNKLRVYLTKVVLCDFDGVSMGEMIVIRSKSINNNYLHKILSSHDFIDSINSLSNGVKVPRPSVHNILNSYIPVPPEDEQIKINETIDNFSKDIDKLVSLYSDKISLLDEQYKSTLSTCITGGSENAEYQ